MLVLKVEIWPFGEQENAEPLAEIHIFNDGSGDKEIGHYWVEDASRGGADADFIGRVKAHPRAKGFWPLLRRVCALMEDMAESLPEDFRATVF